MPPDLCTSTLSYKRPFIPSVQFSCSVMFDSLWPHGLEHTRPPCPLPTPRVSSNLRPLSRWCHPTISSSVVPFSSCLQYLPASGSTLSFCNESVLHIRQPKYWSFNFSISPSKKYSGLISFRMDWLNLLAVQGTLKSLLQQPSSKHQFFGAQLSLQSNSHIHTWLQGKSIALTRWTFVGKIMSLLFNTLSRLVITFLLGLGTSLFYKLCWPCSPKLDVFPGSSSRQGAMITLLAMQVEDFFSYLALWHAGS